MKKIFSTIRVKTNARSKGSALLITLLLLGVLMTLTLGISALVIREIGATQSVVDANKAYYSAEAGVESALLGLAHGFPGFETSAPVSYGPDDTAFDPKFKYDYSISNTTDAVPGFPDDKPIFVEPAVVDAGESGLVTDCKISDGSSPFALAYDKKTLYEDCPRATFRKLALNETAIIPLFSADGSTTLEASDFLVEYYMNVQDGSGLWGEFKGLPLQEFDVLRWKIYGQPLAPTVDNVQKTESIADFYPAIDGNSPTTPVCIGSDPNIRAAGETCKLPGLSRKSLDSLGEDDPKDDTLLSAARECYETDAGTAVTGGALIKGTTLGGAGCSMRSFIDNHKQNYLVLTNMVNPDIVGIFNIHIPTQLARADIYYRVLVRKPVGSEKVPRLVKDFADISANGYAAGVNVVKSLQVKYKAPGFLPVFNFSLYKTKCTPGAADCAAAPSP